MATATHTPNYSLSQYGATDPPKFLTNYNLDMAAIDTAIKAAKDSADGKAAVESGTWTPILYGGTTAGSPAFSTKAAWYVKIGSLVYVCFDVTLASKGGMAGLLKISGLPFAAAKRWGGTCSFATGLSASMYGIAFHGDGGSEIYLDGYYSTGTALLTADNISDTTILSRVTGIYTIS